MPALRIQQLANRRRLDHGKRNPAVPTTAEFEAGELVCLTGPSGSGKTLLLRAIADLDPVVGHIYLNGEERSRVSGPQWRKHVTYVAAESAWWGATVGEHFDSVDPKWWDQFGFDLAILGRSISSLSTGERQRLALIRALAAGAQVLLLDEPTAALDAENTLKTEHAIADYCGETGCVVIWVSHDPAQIARISDRTLNVQSGRVSDSKVDEVHKARR